MLEIHCFLALKQVTVMFYNKQISKENATKCEAIVKELLGADVNFDVRDYYDWDLDQWKSKTADVGAFEDFFS